MHDWYKLLKTEKQKNNKTTKTTNFFVQGWAKKKILIN